jgi:hypothetical protein
MTIEISERTMLVALPESVVGALLQMNASLNAGLADSLQSLIAGSTNEPARRDHEPNAKACPLLQAGKYSAEFLGTTLAAWTLPEIFAQVVDLTAEVAPEALHKLAAMYARKKTICGPQSGSNPSWTPRPCRHADCVRLVDQQEHRSGRPQASAPSVGASRWLEIR